MAIEVIADEADKKREYERILQRRKQHDITALTNPDPSKRYRWINKKSRAVAHAEGNGFAKVDPKGDTQAQFGVTKDGAIHLGEGSDVILMEEPIELYEMKRQADEDRMQSQLANMNAEVKDNLNRIARNEGRVAPGTDVTVDQTRVGRTMGVRAPVTRKPGT